MKVTHDEFLKALKVVNDYKTQVNEEYQQTKKELEKIGLTIVPVTRETLMTDVNLTARTLNALKWVASWYEGTKNLEWSYKTCEVRVKDFEGLKRRELLAMRNSGKKTVEDVERLFFEAGIILK